jgi:RHS repeat-associated protein
MMSAEHENKPGWPVSSDTFYPYGQEQNPTADPNHYKFTSKERDTESALDYFGARHYASTMGRFMSPDPYSGSMDLSNRRALIVIPLSKICLSPLPTPTGEFDEGAGGCLAGPIGCAVGIAATVIFDIGIFENFFNGPSFHGSLAPRPNA